MDVPLLVEWKATQRQAPAIVASDDLLPELKALGGWHDERRREDSVR
jgi:hypothetical protein